MTQDIQQTAVVAIFDSRSGAEHALVALNQEGVDMKRLSIVDKDFHTEQHPNESLRTEQFFVLVHGRNDRAHVPFWGRLDFRT